MSRQSTNWWRKAHNAPTQPAAPTVAITSTSATLSWPTESGATYTLARSTDQTTFTTVYTGSAGTFTNTGLTAAQTYYYRLTETRFEQTSPPSPLVAVSPSSTPVPPVAPADPISSAISASSVTWSWDAVATATAYILERSADGTTGWASRYSGANLTFTDTGLTAATKYYYRLKASNADGTSGASAVVSVTTSATATVPANPTVAPILVSKTSTSADLTLTAVTGATVYVVQQSANAGSTWTTIDSASDTAVTVSGLTASTAYQFRYAAKNAAGTSAGYSPALSVTTDAAATTAGTVQPLSARYARSLCRVVIHQNFAGVYEEVAEVKKWIADIGFSGIRTQWQESRANVTDYLKMCTDLGLKVDVPAQTAGLTASEKAVRAGIKWWSDNAPDVIESFEGINEPSHYTGLAYPAWQDAVVKWQTIIYDEVSKYANLSHVKVLSSAMHEGEALDAVKAGKNWWQELADKGLGDVCDVVALHTYPYSDPPDGGGAGYDLDGRIKLVKDAFPGKPLWVTESGYSSQWPNTDGIYGTAYGGRYPLEMVRRGIPYHHYELLDDRAGDPGSTGVQKDFGLVTVTATTTGWALKTLGSSMKAVMDEWAEPATVTANYTPAKVTCGISTTASDVRWVLTARKAQSTAGTATLFLYRSAVAGATGVTVKVTDAQGERSFTVNANVTIVDLRAPL
jgi:hypothetical protein